MGMENNIREKAFVNFRIYCTLARFLTGKDIGLRKAPTEAFLSCPFSLHTNLTPHFDPKQGQGVKLSL
jgi:hypothetical protein